MKMIITQSNLTLQGGAERVLLKIAQHYDAKIYTAEYDPKTTFPAFKDLDVEVIGKDALAKLLPYGRAAQGLNYGLSFYGMRIKEDYDVLNPHMAPSHWIRNKNERVLWYCHTPLRDVWDLYEYRMGLKKFYQKPIHFAGAKAIRAIDRQVVKKIEFIYANSSNTRSRLVKYFGRNDAQVLPGAVDYQDYHDNGDGKYFLYPSRISPNKQQHVAIDAFIRFKRLHPKGNYKLLLTGSVSKDKFYSDYYDKIYTLVSKDKDIKLLGEIGEAKLKDLYSRATAVLYPPINEDYGLVPLEAMASKKPIIARKEGGPLETVIDNETGFLVTDPGQMAEKMVFVADHPAFAHQMGKAGAKRIKTHYSWSGFFKAFDVAARRVAKT